MDQIENLLEIQSSPEESEQSFDTLGLKPELLKSIKDFGIEKPSKIQPDAIKSILKGQNTIIQSPSGCGKTTAFMIPLLDLLNFGIQDCQVIILVQTRELGLNTKGLMISLAQYMNLNVHCCFGTDSLLNDHKKLRKGVHVVIGNPGRICDLLEKGYLKTDNLKLLILDDADELLSRGFQEQINKILRMLDFRKAQIIVTSVTMTEELKTLSEHFMTNSNIIRYHNESLTLNDGIKHFYVLIDREEWKFETVVDLYEMGKSCIIYCNKLKTSQDVASKLQSKIPTASIIHYNMDKTERSQAIKDFESITPSILITTNLFFQKPENTIIINYDLPLNKNIYLERNGKTNGSAAGTVINFVLPNEFCFLQELEKFYNINITELPAEVNSFV